jgi:hypothetical protein
VAQNAILSWRVGLPKLHTARAVLREPVPADAPAMFREFCTPEVCEFTIAPPTDLAGVERTIQYAHCRSKFPSHAIDRGLGRAPHHAAWRLRVCLTWRKASTILIVDNSGNLLEI